MFFVGIVPFTKNWHIIARYISFFIPNFCVYVFSLIFFFLQIGYQHKKNAVFDITIFNICVGNWSGHNRGIPAKVYSSRISYMRRDSFSGMRRSVSCAPVRGCRPGSLRESISVAECVNETKRFASRGRNLVGDANRKIYARMVPLYNRL